MEGSDKIYALAHLNPRPEHRYLLNLSLGKEYGRFARIGEDQTLLTLPRIEPRLVKSLALS